RHRAITGPFPLELSPVVREPPRSRSALTASQDRVLQPLLRLVELTRVAAGLPLARHLSRGYRPCRVSSTSTATSDSTMRRPDSTTLRFNCRTSQRLRATSSATVRVTPKV